MTTIQVREDQAAADAFGALAERLERAGDGGAVYARNLRASATPNNGHAQPAAVPFEARPRLAAVAREIAAEGGPYAAELAAFAGGLDASLRQVAVNDPGKAHLAPAPQPDPNVGVGY